MFNLPRDFKTYHKCPEIRAHVRQMYAAKLAGIITVVIFSPLLVVGLAAIGIVHLFDYIGQFSLWPAHKITGWLHEYQRSQITSAHAILSIEEIQTRTGRLEEDNSEDDDPKDGIL